jgi:hypothetical protein
MTVKMVVPVAESRLFWGFMRFRAADKVDARIGSSARCASRAPQSCANKTKIHAIAYCMGN